jgi:Methyltransferase domain
VPGWAVTALDASQPALDAARHQLDVIGTEQQRMQLHFIQGNMTALPVPDKSVHVVLAFNVLEQIPDVPAALREVCIFNPLCYALQCTRCQDDQLENELPACLVTLHCLLPCRHVQDVVSVAVMTGLRRCICGCDDWTM